MNLPNRAGNAGFFQSRAIDSEPSPFVEIHPDDATEIGLVAGQLALLFSRRGLVQLPVRINPGLSV